MDSATKPTKDEVIFVRVDASLKDRVRRGAVIDAEGNESLFSRNALKTYCDIIEGRVRLLVVSDSDLRVA